MEDGADKDVVDRAADTVRRKRCAQGVHVRFQLSAGRVAGEAVVHQVERGVLRGQRGDRHTEDPGVLDAADVRPELVDVNHLGHDGEDRLLRNADNLEPVANGDVIEVGKGPRQRDLGRAGRPAPRSNADLSNVAARVVAADSGHQVFMSTRLKLDVGRSIGTAVAGRPDEGRRSGDRTGINPAVERSLQMSAFLRIECQLVRVTRLRDEG